MKHGNESKEQIKAHLRELRYRFRAKSWPKRLRRYFVAGIAVLFPAFVSIYVVIALFNFVNGLVGEGLNLWLFENTGVRVPGVGFLVALGVIMVAGILSRNWMGNKLLVLIEVFMKRAPVFTSIYPSAKQLSDFLFAQQKERAFKEAVLVEYPQAGSFSLGFVTSDSLPGLSARTDHDILSVFVPFAPAPFSGLILLVARTKVVPVNVPVDQALKFVVSGGIVSPELFTRGRSGQPVSPVARTEGGM